FGVSGRDLFSQYTVQDRGMTLRIESTPEIERVRARAIGVQPLQPRGRFDEGRHVIVGDPPDDMIREFAFPKPLIAQCQCPGMETGIRESTHGLQVSPEGQRTRDIRMKLLRKESRADELSPTVQACIGIEMGARDETLAPLRLLQSGRDPVDKAFRTR